MGFYFAVHLVIFSTIDYHFYCFCSAYDKLVFMFSYDLEFKTVCCSHFDHEATGRLLTLNRCYIVSEAYYFDN